MIKKLRLKKEMTQDELAKELNIGQSTVAMWENGANSPRTSQLPELAKIFDCKIDDLFLNNTA